jgi:NDP-sugar pyrophosphorylase family protein
LNTPVLNDEARDSIRKHVLASMEYMENGLLMLNKQEAGKASELLWGGVSQALEAVAESRNVRLSNHRSLRYFVSELSRETGDRSINDAFYQAESLHGNFHSIDMTVEDVVTNIDAIRELVSKLLSMVPLELVNQKEAQM